MSITVEIEHRKGRTMKHVWTIAVAAVIIAGTIGMSPNIMAAVRVDARGTAGFHIATGLERIGSADGSSVTEWDTMQAEDGWVTLTSGGALVDVLVLNGPSVVGGMLLASEIWDDSRIVVVRDDVVVPSGVTLTLGADCIVKFTEGARIVVEDGGAVVSEGAYLAAFDDDSVGGDTDMNGAAVDGEGAVATQWWLDDPAVAALATVRFVDGTTNLPTRTYSVGAAFGALPELRRNDAMFGGWWTARDGEGAAATQGDVVEGGETVLYAYWIPYELGIEPSSATVTAVASEGFFIVSVNSGWESSCDADWVTVRRVGDSQVVYVISENASTEARTTTVRVTSEGGLSRDFTLTQSAMSQLASPTISPADGTTFIGSSRRVSITGVDSGAEIRYTLDGSEPTATSKLYTKSFNIFDTTIVKARAFKSGNLASAAATARIVRLQTLAEALDVPLWTVTTDGDAEWAVAESEGRNRGVCARSGVIGDEQATTLTTSVDGAGTLAFWWKTDCEDDPDYDNWDYLTFKVDGAEVARIDGDSGWQQVSVKVKSDASHTLTWTYSKDYMADEMTGIEDCGWVDQITWTPLVGDGEVPVAWIENLGLVATGATAAESADLDPDGDGLTTAQEYIAGTDPTDPDSKFTASIEIVEGRPVVSYSPDLLGERQYKKLGKNDIGNPDEAWVEVKDGEEGNYNFFKVIVDLP